jgi:hypothetical protein
MQRLMDETLQRLEADARGDGFKGDLLQLERKVLASVFRDPRTFDAFSNVSPFFDDRRHKAIWPMMAEARIFYSRIDVNAVVQRLEWYGYLDTYAGGLAYVAALPDALGSEEDVSSVLADWKVRSGCGSRG